MALNINARAISFVICLFLFCVFMLLSVRGGVSWGGCIFKMGSKVYIYSLLGMNVFMSYPGDSIEIAILIKFLVRTQKWTVYRVGLK